MRLHNHFYFLAPKRLGLNECHHNFLKMRVKENVALSAAKGLSARY